MRLLACGRCGKTTTGYHECLIDTPLSPSPEPMTPEPTPSEIPNSSPPEMTEEEMRKVRGWCDEIFAENGGGFRPGSLLVARAFDALSRQVETLRKALHIAASKSVASQAICDELTKMLSEARDQRDAARAENATLTRERDEALKEMGRLWVLSEPTEGKPCVYVGVYVTKWGRENSPSVAFDRFDADEWLSAMRADTKQETT